MVVKPAGIHFVLDSRKRQVGRLRLPLNSQKLTVSILDKHSGLQPVQKEKKQATSVL